MITNEERLEALKRIDYLSKFRWDCGTDPCNGRPHGDYPYPHARTAQLPPKGNWFGWFMCSGRGSGKTRAGSEYCKSRGMSEKNMRIAIVAPTIAKGRDACVEGESGLRGLYDGQGVIPWEYIANWNRSMGELTLTNGTVFKLFSADDDKSADIIRGFQCHLAWFEELAAMPSGDHAWAMMEFALRLGKNPQVIITSTPRPTKIVKRLVEDPDINMTYGSTYDNADNLPELTLRRLKRLYEGTTLGQQELYGKILAEAIGAMWNAALLRHIESPPADLARIVVAVDPAGSHRPSNAETGILAVGMSVTGRLYVLADRSGHYSPEEWSRTAIMLYRELQADRIVAEKNYGGDMVQSTLRSADSTVPVKLVNATRGKQLRAEPVVSLYERELVEHVGMFSELETQQLEWVPPGRFDQDGEPIPPSAESPDRVDALVWAVTDLALAGKAKRGTMHYYA